MMIFTWYIGTLLALNWSFPSVYTNSVARAYLLPALGLDGAGDGGRSCPARSTCGNAFFTALPSFPAAAAAVAVAPGGGGPDSDITASIIRENKQDSKRNESPKKTSNCSNSRCQYMPGISQTRSSCGFDIKRAGRDSSYFFLQQWKAIASSKAGTKRLCNPALGKMKVPRHRKDR